MPADPEEIVQYFVVNKDLAMSSGKLAAQAAHAATLSALAGSKSTGQAKEWFDAWLTGTVGHMKKIVLAGTESELKDLAAKGGFLVTDAGYTEIPAGSLTVVALAPMPRAVAAPLVAGLRLYKGPTAAPTPASPTQGLKP